MPGDDYFYIGKTTVQRLAKIIQQVIGFRLDHIGIVVEIDQRAHLQEG